MVLIRQESCHLPQQKSHCIQMKPENKYLLKDQIWIQPQETLQIKRLASRNLLWKLPRRNTPRLYVFFSVILKYSQFFKLNPISVYYFNQRWCLPSPAQSVQGVRVTYKVVAVLTWCQLCTNSTKDKGCSHRPRPQSCLWCQRRPQKQISQACSSHVSYWSCKFLLLTEAKHLIHLKGI